MPNDLNMRIEKDGNEWVAIIPPHPDMPDEELGLPAATKELAEAEGRAYRAIEQSALYHFDFDEKNGVYIVSIGKEGEDFQAPLLAEAYKQAQEAYTKRVNEPPQPDPAPPPRAKPGRKPRGNGAQAAEPKEVKAEPEVLPPEAITSGRQVQDAAHRARIDRLEAVLIVFAQTILKELKDDK